MPPGRRGPRKASQGLRGSDAGAAHGKAGRAPPPPSRPRRPAGQSAPTALTDGPAARSWGGPARAPRWADGAEARAGPAPRDPAVRPSTARFPLAAAAGRARASPGTTAAARSAVRTHFSLDGPSARRLRGPRRAGCPAARPPSAASSQAPPRPGRLEPRTEIHPDSLDSVGASLREGDTTLGRAPQPHPPCLPRMPRGQPAMKGRKRVVLTVFCSF